MGIRGKIAKQAHSLAIWLRLNINNFNPRAEIRPSDLRGILLPKLKFFALNMTLIKVLRELWEVKSMC